MYKLVRIALFFLVLITGFSCADKEPIDSCFRVKCLGYLCGQANFEILDKDYYYLGQEDWKDANGNTVKHVFKTILSCSDIKALDAAIKPGAFFYTNLVTGNTDRECAYCKALLFGPDTFHYVNIYESPCK